MFWLLLKMKEKYTKIEVKTDLCWRKITPRGDHYNIFFCKTTQKNLHTSKIEMRITIGNIRYTQTICFHTTQVIA